MNEVISKSLKIKAISSSESMKDAHFFNSSNFLGNKLFKVKGWQLIKEKPVAQIFFYIHNGIAISGYQSTFGSFDVLDCVTNDELKWFVRTLIIELKECGVVKVKIKNFPSYFRNADLIEDVLVASGFDNVLIETNQHIAIEDISFDKLISRNERKKITQCIKRGFTFSIVGVTELAPVYDLIVEIRARKKYSLSMSFEELNNAIAANPDNYKLFVIKDGELIIAISVSVVINGNVLYNFYHADDFNYRNFSPIAFLVSEIYNYCEANNYSILDLGTSSVERVLNDGLFNFKKNLGAKLSNKIEYTLSL